MLSAILPLLPCVLAPLCMVTVTTSTITCRCFTCVYKSPPTPVLPSPTLNVILPPLPPVDLPLVNAIVTVLPSAVSPVVNPILPLTPAVPPSDVLIDTAPLDVAVPLPLAIVIAPPILSAMQM